MEGVPIKFRGRCSYDGRYTYAEIIIDSEGVHITNDADGGHEWKVEPDSIRQLVGYDKNGNEIYELDELGDDCGNNYRAELVPTCLGEHRDFIFVGGRTIVTLTGSTYDDEERLI